MLMPKRIKYRRMHRGNRRGMALRGSSVDFGEFGLKAMGPAWITSRQIEAARIAMTRYIKRGGKVWIRIFPDKPITKKPAETRQGSGKGDVDFWAAVVKPGTVIYELGGVSEEVAKRAFNRVAHKLPVKVRLVRRRPN